ncbi:hypothetical protein T05_14451 [Trichinella murrelli]|uniref:Uncharacterized protein n=1 Tax=Trichinella murrelli TaxID=144512 RepID=A0A0V0SV43_9BILA|nr:hypothetical protein T05_14451 [Trichinella murrelli]
MSTNLSFYEQQRKDLFFEPVKHENIMRRNPNRNWLENMAVFYGQFKRSPTR